MEKNSFFDLIRKKIEDEIKKGLEGMEGYEDLGKKFAEKMKGKQDKWEGKKKEESTEKDDAAGESIKEVKIEVKDAKNKSSKKNKGKVEVNVNPLPKTDGTKKEEKTNNVYAEAEAAMRKQFEEEFELMKIRHRISLDELQKAQQLIRDQFKDEFEEKIRKL